MQLRQRKTERLTHTWVGLEGVVPLPWLSVEVSSGRHKRVDPSTPKMRTVARRRGSVVSAEVSSDRHKKSGLFRLSSGSTSMFSSTSKNAACAYSDANVFICLGRIGTSCTTAVFHNKEGARDPPLNHNKT